MTTLKRFGWIALMGSMGCATLPNVSETIGEAPAGGAPRRIVSAKGLLSSTTSNAIMDRLARSAGSTDILQRFTAVIESVSGTPVTSGNKVTLLIDGPIRPMPRCSRRLKRPESPSTLKLHPRR
jgi:cardiolipin synthase